MEILYVLIVAAVLAIQIVEESVLAMHVKRLLGLAPYPSTLYVLTKFKNWWTLLGTLRLIILMPIILLSIIVFNIHQFFSKVLECSVCTSYHIAFWLIYLYLDYGIIDSMIYAPLSIVVVYLLNKIRYNN